MAASRTRAVSPGVAPVLVMNPYYSGVAIARLLAPRGVPVFALFSDPKAPGRRSRHFAGEYRVPDGGVDAEGLVRTLLELAKDLPSKPVIFPTRDLDVTFLRTNRHRLDHALIISMAEERAQDLLSDKQRLADLAATLGVKCPRTVELADEDGIADVARRLDFPVVIKPVRSHEWRSEEGKQASESRKAIVVADANELLGQYRAVARVTPRVVVQEFVPGPDESLVICGCYMDRLGRMAGAFTARKLLQSPPLAGTGCLVALDDVPDVVGPTETMLRSAGYFGIAEAEYKRDPRDGRYALIEINLRHWDQHELGTLAGVDVTWLAYREAVGLPLEKEQMAAPSVRGTWVAERELVDLVLRHGLGVIYTGDAAGSRQRIRRPLMFGVCRLADPVPGVRLASGVLLDLSVRMIRRVRKGLMSRRHSAPIGAQADR